jgi:Fe-S-cluster containining protein
MQIPPDGKKYGYYHKLRQLVVYLKRRDKNRSGECRRCGACCRFMADCIFLKFDDQGRSECGIQKIKPYTCSKYPLKAKEHHTRAICGDRVPDDAV